MLTTVSSEVNSMTVTSESNESDSDVVSSAVKYKIRHKKILD